MLKENTKNLIQNMAKDIRTVYDFSLVPIKDNYMDIQQVAEKLGGGILFEDVYETQVCRCGSGFIIKLPKNDTRNMMANFGEALAMLFFKMRYSIDNVVFANNENMKFIKASIQDYDILQELADELICSSTELRSYIKENSDEAMNFNLETMAIKLKLNRDYLEARLVRIGCIKHWSMR